MTDQPPRFSIASDMELSIALANLRKWAMEKGFGANDATRFVTAASELGRNILKYARKGYLDYSTTQRGMRTGLKLSAIDKGPGIADVDKAMGDHFSTSGTLGLGLPGVKRLVDEFEIESSAEHGTTATIRMWKR